MFPYSILCHELSYMLLEPFLPLIFRANILAPNATEWQRRQQRTWVCLRELARCRWAWRRPKARICDPTEPRTMIALAIKQESQVPYLMSTRFLGSLTPSSVGQHIWVRLCTKNKRWIRNFGDDPQTNYWAGGQIEAVNEKGSTTYTNSRRINEKWTSR